MVTDILDVSKAEAGKLELDLAMAAPADVAEEARKQVAFLAQSKGVHLIAEVEPDLPELLLDEEKLRRVLVNLLANAIQHTSVNGQVTISAARAPESEEVVFGVADNGAGIAPEMVRGVFEKFGRGGPGRHGRVSSGLGLSFSKLAVEAHGGTIEVQSTLGEGTTFTVRLPSGKARLGV